MGIQFNRDNKTFHLQAKDSSYLLQITPYQYVAHLYWGKQIAGWHGANPIRYLDRGIRAESHPGKPRFFLGHHSFGISFIRQ
ncbi:hypothetical protein HMSSN036_31930 [Paenibacillus macerans]|nr:hypothetical protein HMSSN036_31930 [Paenibacillus macerans]